MTEIHKTIIIGLGNTILCDDAVGIIVAKKLYAKVKNKQISFCESSFAGWRIIDIINGYDKVIIVDVIKQNNLEIGKCYKVEAKKNMCINLNSSHGLGIFESLELAKQNGWSMPKVISVYGINVQNPYEFGEYLTPQVKKNISKIVKEIIKEEHLERQL